MRVGRGGGDAIIANEVGRAKLSDEDHEARAQRALTLLEGRAVTSEYLLAALEGQGPDVVDERKRVREEADRIEGLPIADWPPFDVLWDTRREAQRFAFDGMNAESFEKSFPDGLILARVKLAELDSAMTEFNRRTPEEVWSIGSPDKAARCIIHWKEGRGLTPVCLCPVNGKIGLAGGNHRLAVARAKGTTEIPAYIQPQHFDEIAAIIAFLP